MQMWYSKEMDQNTNDTKYLPNVNSTGQHRCLYVLISIKTWIIRGSWMIRAIALNPHVTFALDVMDHQDGIATRVHHRENPQVIMLVRYHNEDLATRATITIVIFPCKFQAGNDKVESHPPIYHLLHPNHFNLHLMTWYLYIPICFPPMLTLTINIVVHITYQTMMVQDDWIDCMAWLYKHLI